MGLVRISSVTPLDGFHLRLVPTDGSVILIQVEAVTKVDFVVPAGLRASPSPIYYERCALG